MPRSSASLAAIVCVALALTASAQSPFELHLARHFTAGQSFRLRWSQGRCDGTTTDVTKTLVGLVTVASVDHAGSPTGIELTVESATDREAPVPSAGLQVSVARLTAAAARRASSPWGGPLPAGSAGGWARLHLALEILVLGFPDRPDVLFGRRGPVSVGDHWPLGPLERREGAPLQSYRLRGTVRLEGREQNVSHVIVDGENRDTTVLWNGEYRSELRAAREVHELWVPDDPQVPWPRVRVRRARTVWSNAPELVAHGPPQPAGPRETSAQLCDEITSEPVRAPSVPP